MIAEQPEPTISKRRKWIFRILAATLIPPLVLVLLETGLWIFGFGYPTDFFIESGDDSYVTNHHFGRRFFPREIARTPVACQIGAEKPDSTLRIFVLGGSAAMGTPDPAFGLAPTLEAMLCEAFPDRKFEVVNAAMTAINSHVVLPIARNCAELDADLFVVYMGNNEVVGPYGPCAVFDGAPSSLWMIRSHAWLKTTKTGQLIDNTLSGDDKPARGKGMEMFLKDLVAADDPRMEDVYSHFDDNLEDICDVAADAGAHVILCTVATNLQNCPPFASINDRAENEYRRALVLLSGKRRKEARHHFVKARDLDALRFRADTRINEIIRAVAGGKSANLVDAELSFLESGNDKELFYEHVHMTPEGMYMLARAVFIETAKILGYDRPDIPTAQRCRDRVALTGWDRLRMARSIADMTSRPPFTAQLDHDRRQCARLMEIARLRILHASPPGLRDALETYQAAIRQYGASPQTAAHYAQLLLENGRCDESAGKWRQLLEIFPHMSEWRVSLGIALENCGRHEQAVSELLAAIEIDPRVEATARFNIGTSLLRRDRFEQAAGEFQRAIEIDPEMADACNSLGAAMLKTGKPGEAEKYWRKAIEIDPGLVRAYRNLESVLLKRKDSGAAEQLYRDGIEKAPGTAELHYRLGNLLIVRSDVKGAVSQFRDAVRLDPGHARAAYNLGVALVRLNRKSEAVPILNKAMDLAARWEDRQLVVKIKQMLGN